MGTDESRNMRLLGHHESNGFGNCGEGMVIQLARGVVYTVARFTGGLYVLELNL